MSEKPFWAGKTLMEIQNLDKRVKVTMENGDVFIGKLVRRSRDTDGICSLSMQLDAHRTYLHVFSAESSDTQPIIPSYVDTVELLDDPNYERIEEADDLQEKDITKPNRRRQPMSDYKQRMIREHRENCRSVSASWRTCLRATRRARWTSRPRAPSSSLKANCTRWGHTRTSYRSVRVSNRWI